MEENRELSVTENFTLAQLGAKPTHLAYHNQIVTFAITVRLEAGRNRIT